MFELSNLDVSVHAEQGVEVQIINPRDDTPTGIVIKVLGVFAPRFKELLRQAKRRDEIAKKNPVAKAVNDAAGDDEEIAILLAEVTLGWTGLQEYGKDIPFSKSEAVRIYTHYVLVRQQVFNAALDVSNFVKG